MKYFLYNFRNCLLTAIILLFVTTNSKASHIVGAQLSYKWDSGLTYTLTIELYGDCGSTSRVAFETLPVATPQVCIFNGATSVSNVSLTIVGNDVNDSICGYEVSPVCPDSLPYTQCKSLSYTIPGIKKFVYSKTVVLPSNSSVWRFIYTSNNGSTPGNVNCSFYTATGVLPSAAGRTATITNIAGTTSIQLIDTLNTLTSRGHNSNPVLTVPPTPYYCLNTLDCYNPGAIDLYDTSTLYHEPAGDSMVFSLVDATRGNANCTIGGPVTYVAANAWPGQPLGGSTPLQVAASTDFSFDPVTGQICFTPNVTQRSTVVYNIDEYFRDTLVGTMQREMNFLVLPCVLTNPTAPIDSFTAGALADTTNGTSFYACQYSGIFELSYDPREADTSLTITITATGLTGGITFVVTNNGTNHPHGDLIGNTNTILPGTYTFFLRYTDNHCPLVGTSTVAYTVTIYPVPNIRDSILSAATCTDKEGLLIIPGGYGKPWTIKVSDITGDTIQVFTDTTAFIDSLPPGTYHLTIFTAASNLCHVDDTIHVDTPGLTFPTLAVNPQYCGGKDGEIVISTLTPFEIDTVLYQHQGIWQPPIGFVTSAAGTDTIGGLIAGIYNKIIVIHGNCRDSSLIPDTLVNPPFTFRAITSANPTKCGYCDGSDTLYGLHPNQLDTITYYFGSTLYTNTNFIATDSAVVFTGLCAGTYTNFTVQTAGVCNATIHGPINLVAPGINAAFTDNIIYGCKGDSIQFFNGSTPAGLSYVWYFGDSYTDTSANPIHYYANTHNITDTVVLLVTNGKCVQTDTIPILLDNYIKAGFSMEPWPYVCQGSPVTFTDTSVGASPAGMGGLGYNWNFGDGLTGNTFNEIHTYPRTGKYTVMLVANNAIPCYDTAYGTIQVDSISPISIVATDSVLCRGTSVNFQGLFTTIGDTGVIWSFGDGNSIHNINPVLHSYDGTGTLTVTVSVLYRACPELTASRTIQVYPNPEIYLGEDQSFCPGGQPILLSDETNATTPGASWIWNTGQTTSSIYVDKPGIFYETVTINGCSATDTVVVKNDCYISLPNVFTPNGDGVNDYFFPRQVLTSGLIKFSMEIYNRWGQEVYQTSSTDGRGWDGNLNNVPQPDGVYVYVIDATFKDGQTEHHQGNLTLIR